MKTLFLIRHAKSSWDDTALPDKDRPLGDRGRRDAPKMGKRLAKRDVKPDLILSSPARRALTTAEIIAKKLDYKLKHIVVDDRLYAGAVHDLLNVVHKLGDKLERVMLFGHNPELTELAHRLSSEITHMPTCAVAEFTFNAKSWSNIGKAKLAKGRLLARPTAVLGFVGAVGRGEPWPKAVGALPFRRHSGPSISVCQA